LDQQAVKGQAFTSSIDPYRVLEDYQKLAEKRKKAGYVSGLSQMDDCDRYEVSLWNVLGIPVATKGKPWGETSMCGVGLEEIDWNGDDVSDVVLLFGGYDQWDYRYLLFVRDGAGFRFVGYLDNFSKYAQQTSPKIIKFMGRSFLETLYSSGGSGVNEYIVSWAELTPKGRRDVLSYPKQGADSEADPARAWEASIRNADMEQGIVEIELSISYGVQSRRRGDPDFPLFTKSYRTVYNWNPSSERFVLNPVKSTLGNRELKEAFTPESGLSGFVEWYLPELEDIARKGTSQQKTWLRLWLLVEPASEPRASLLKLLN